MKKIIKISLGFIIGFLIINSSYAVILYDAILDKRSNVKIISENDCISAGIYTRKYSYEEDSFSYELIVSSNCKKTYIYSNNLNKILLNKYVYEKLHSYISYGSPRVYESKLNLYKKYEAEDLIGKKNIVSWVYDGSINGEFGEFTRELVNIDDENDVIIIKGKINRDLKSKVKILLGKDYINLILGILILLIFLGIYKRKFLMKIIKSKK